MEQIAHELGELLAISKHARIDRPVLENDQDARRFCRVVLHDLSIRSTTTEVALARYLERKLEPSERDDDEQRAVDIMKFFLNCHDSERDVLPWVHQMRNSRHPVCQAYVQARDALEDGGVPAIPGGKLEGDVRRALADVRRAVATHELDALLDLASHTTKVHARGSEPGGRVRPQFRECPSCATKPGSPDLCAPCLHNRALIGALDRLFEVGAELRERRLNVKSKIDRHDRAAVDALNIVIDEMLREGWSI